MTAQFEPRLHWWWRYFLRCCDIIERNLEELKRDEAEELLDRSVELVRKLRIRLTDSVD